MDLPFGSQTFLCHPLILKHINLPPRWSSYFEAFLATNPPILLTPLSYKDISSSPLPFNRELLNEHNRPYGITQPEHFLLQRRLTIGNLASIMLPYPFTAPPPTLWAPPGYTKAQASILKKIWMNIPTSWKTIISTESFGTTRFGVHYLQCSISTPSTIYELQTTPTNHITGHPWTLQPSGSYHPNPLLPTLFPSPPKTITPIYTSQKFAYLGSPLLPATRHRLDIQKTPTAASLRKTLAPLFNSDQQSTAEANWTARNPQPFSWKHAAKAISTNGIPLKARDTLIRVLFRTIQVNSRVRTSQDESACPLCGEHESIQHCFTQCGHVQEIVRCLKSCLFPLFRSPPPTDIQLILFSTPNPTHAGVWQTLLGIVLQHIWKSRCDQSIQKERPPPPHVTATLILGDFELALQSHLHSLAQNPSKRAEKRLRLLAKFLITKKITSPPFPSSPTHSMPLSPFFRSLWPSQPLARPHTDDEDARRVNIPPHHSSDCVLTRHTT